MSHTHITYFDRDNERVCIVQDCDTSPWEMAQEPCEKATLAQQIAHAARTNWHNERDQELMALNVREVLAGWGKRPIGQAFATAIQEKLGDRYAVSYSKRDVLDWKEINVWNRARGYNSGASIHLLVKIGNEFDSLESETLKYTSENKHHRANSEQAKHEEANAEAIAEDYQKLKEQADAFIQKHGMDRPTFGQGISYTTEAFLPGIKEMTR